MKVLFILFVTLFVSLPSFAQVLVGAVDINQADSVEVIEVLIDRRTLGKGVDVYVDYGQQDNITATSLGYKNHALRIMDVDTKMRKVFISTAAVLNFFEKNNWVLISNSVVDKESCYYFRRRGR